MMRYRLRVWINLRFLLEHAFQVLEGWPAGDGIVPTPAVGSETRTLVLDKYSTRPTPGASSSVSAEAGKYFNSA